MSCGDNRLSHIAHELDTTAGETVMVDRNPAEQCSRKKRPMQGVYRCPADLQRDVHFRPKSFSFASVERKKARPPHCLHWSPTAQTSTALQLCQGELSIAASMPLQEAWRQRMPVHIREQKSCFGSEPNHARLLVHTARIQSNTRF